jgi:hypothetical protein
LGLTHVFFKRFVSDALEKSTEGWLANPSARLIQVAALGVAAVPAWSCAWLGNHNTIKALTQAMADMVSIKLVKPAALMKGPSKYTAKELMPKDTAMRTPLTRERIELSM